jgi:phage terminase large subunit GpA-like protein
LEWAQVKWEKDTPTSAWYECIHCQKHLSDAERLAMVRRGEWRARHPERRVRGYHINGIATPFRCARSFENRLHQMAVQFLNAKAGGSMQLRAWVNTFLAESWEEQAERIPEGELQKRAEAYGPKVPVSVLVLTCGVDVQADRLELEVVGWGLQEESWGIVYRVIPGRPDDPLTWTKLEEFLQTKFIREDGLEMRVVVTGVDYGAFTDDVLRWTRTRFARGIVGVKGSPAAGAPMVSALRRNNRFRAAVMTWADQPSRSFTAAPRKRAPRYCHFQAWPSGMTGVFWLTPRNCRRLPQGSPSWWHKTRQRNEPLDARVYAFAMLRYLNPNWTKLAAGLQRKMGLSKDSAAGRVTAPLREEPGVVKPPGTSPPQSAGKRRPNYARIKVGDLRAGGRSSDRLWPRFIMEDRDGRPERGLRAAELAKRFRVDNAEINEVLSHFALERPSVFQRVNARCWWFKVAQEITGTPPCCQSSEPPP